MDQAAIDLLRKLALSRGIAFSPDRLPRGEWMHASDGVRLHYLDWPGPGDVLLLLHGGALTAHTFDLLALAISGSIRCIALDMRGHGLSDWSDDYAIDRFATDVIELIEALDLPGVHIAGMSLGGCVAGHAAPRLGGRLKSLVFIDVADRPNFPATARMRAFIEQVRPVPRIEDLVEQALAVSPRTDPDLMAYRYRHLLKPGPDGFTWKQDRRRSADYAGILRKNAELADLAPQIPCPVMVVKGGRSEVLSQQVLERFAGRFPRGASVVIADAGHNVQEDQPVLLAKAIAATIARAAAEGKANALTSEAAHAVAITHRRSR